MISGSLCVGQVAARLTALQLVTSVATVVIVHRWKLLAVLVEIMLGLDITAVWALVCVPLGKHAGPACPKEVVEEIRSPQYCHLRRQRHLFRLSLEPLQLLTLSLSLSKSWRSLC